MPNKIQVPLRWDAVALLGLPPTPPLLLLLLLMAK
jgi:hypothetical protein